MKSLLEDEEVKESEITLSTASLLGIFFGLVLICGVFFGFGYSMGRGAHGTQATAPAEANETAAVAAAPPPQPALLAPALQDDSTAVQPQPPAIKTVISKPSASRAMPNVAPAPEDAAAQPMVQIAAVARPEDADALVAALRQRGYGVVVRNEPQDKLLHVQVGPFADRTLATAMKQKLLSDGYNAIIKQ